MGWKTELNNAKLRHRPRLKGSWERDGMHEVFPRLVEKLEKQENYQAFFVDDETATKRQNQTVPAILDAANTTREDFYRYEVNEFPTVIRNIPAGFDGAEYVGAWAAQEKWQFEALENNATLLERRFKCGEDDDEENIKVKLKHFLSYTEENKDDSPLYIFDSSFEDDRHADRLLRDYRVPSYFADDLFRLISESRRPPYRWWLVGPKRSGTCVHIDPLATSAWNTLIVGRKRWVLFPPHVPKSVVKGSGLIRDDEDDEAVHYFSFILPRIKRKATLMRGMPKYKGFCCYEFFQEAGETVYVPNGWWHAVLNITDTIAVTQNFCSPRNFDKVWKKTRTGRKRMAWKWLCALEKEYPDLAARAKAMNEHDNFKMKYDPVEVEKRERAERQRMADIKRRKEEKRRQKLMSPLSSATSTSSDISTTKVREDDAHRKQSKSSKDDDSDSSSSGSSSSDSDSENDDTSSSTEVSKPKRSRIGSPRSTTEAPP